MRTLLFAFLLAFAASASAQEVTYDEFGQMSIADKIRVFNEVDPANRAMLVRTQAERWLLANRDQLSEEQVAVVEEATAFIRPEMYDEADREAEQAAMQEVMEKLTAALPRSAIAQAFTIEGPYISAQR